jgi:hypothetical protein
VSFRERRGLFEQREGARRHEKMPAKLAVSLYTGSPNKLSLESVWCGRITWGSRLPKPLIAFVDF